MSSLQKAVALQCINMGGGVVGVCDDVQYSYDIIFEFICCLSVSAPGKRDIDDISGHRGEEPIPYW
jgi:hypothetical protein